MNEVELGNIKVGDELLRSMGGVVMPILVSEVTEDRIVCGPWEFCRKTGAEIDEDLGWGNEMTGSFIMGVVEDE
jgi:hypothetical protein